jgi:hypothetical protein
VRAWARLATPTVVVFVNAVAFWFIRPNVPDLWAARARASAVRHGVGLTYWFSWFGGSTPANYSVITPYVSAKLGTELVAAAAAVVLIAIVTVLVVNTPRPQLAAMTAAFAVVVNLWCGRVPFLLGCAFGAAALLCVQRRAKVGAAVLSVGAVLASPVAGVFLCLALPGVVLTGSLRRYRMAALVAAASAGTALVTLAVVFGTPGTEPFPAYLLGEIALILALMYWSAPSDHVRVTLLASGVAAVVLYIVPTGLGANLSRLALFGLPPAVVAVSRRPARILTMLVTPILVLGLLSSASAIRSAISPGSSADYYAPLAAEMDALPAADYRLELVGARHAAYAALLDHAVLARGWETQEDHVLAGRLEQPSLDAQTYRGWLDDNAVGFVAVNLPGGNTPEGRLIADDRPGYLRPIWRSAHWQLFAVARRRPIVAMPAKLTASTQSALTVRIPCTCRAVLRIRWSKFLHVAPDLARGTPDSIEDTYAPMLGRGLDGWTTLATNRAGTYVLTGSL